MADTLTLLDAPGFFGGVAGVKGVHSTRVGLCGFFDAIRGRHRDSPVYRRFQVVRLALILLYVVVWCQAGPT